MLGHFRPAPISVRVSLLVLLSLLFASAGLASGTEELLSRGRTELEAERYESAELLFRQALQQEASNGEATFLLGMALAKQERWADAERELERAVLLRPGDAAAHAELAGVYFKQDRRDKARASLGTALKLDPKNSYARSFLAILSYLQDRRLEALHHWNLLGEPQIAQIQVAASEDAAPKLVESLFRFNEEEVLERRQLLQAYWVQTRFRLGPRFGWQLDPQPGGRWDLSVDLPPASDSFSNKTGFLIENSSRAVFNREIGLGLRDGRGRRLAGGARWDAPRKRAGASAWFPFFSSSSDLLRLGFDVRDEEWSHTASGTEYDYRTEKVFGGYEWLMSARRSLAFHGGYQRQEFRFGGDASQHTQSPHLLAAGLEWNQLWGLDAGENARLSWMARFDAFSPLAGGGDPSHRMMSGLGIDWTLARKTESRLRLSIQGGVSGRDLPLDHYFLFGIGPDARLPLKAHPELRDSRKGNSPMGRDFVLLGAELGRRLWRWGLLEVGGFVFSDTAFVSGRPFLGGAAEWFQDVGVGVRFRVLGQDFLNVFLGLDTRSRTFHHWAGLPSVGAGAWSNGF
ncbi:MAG: tetratricopeptide repeat protein [Acidobacteriota bacterium]|nr:tetratricopeptide repeat protein [Acidobacteriota bacterium]